MTEPNSARALLPSAHTHVALIGCGGIARELLGALRNNDPSRRVRVIGALARRGRAAALAEVFGEIELFEDLQHVLAAKPNIVAEVAGQAAVAQYGEAVLNSGADFLPISIGALADPDVFARLKTAAEKSGARILLAAGAIGGIDALAAMRLGGLRFVRYRSIKPPAAWRGSPAEEAVDLDRLNGRAVLYTGSAGEASIKFPQNANVAATIALAGLGFDATQVELIADSQAPGNIHEIEAEGASGRMTIQLQGKPSPTNPKTSALTALSIARSLINDSAIVVI